MTKRKKTGRPPTYTDAQIIGALERSGGMMSAAAKVLGCARSTVYERVQASPEIRDALETIRETALDAAEMQLMRAINAGNMTAVIFFLKTKGRARGYSERIDVNAEHNHEHTHTIEAISADLDARLDQLIERAREAAGDSEAEEGTRTLN